MRKHSLCRTQWIWKEKSMKRINIWGCVGNINRSVKKKITSLINPYHFQSLTSNCWCIKLGLNTQTWALAISLPESCDYLLCVWQVVGVGVVLLLWAHHHTQGVYVVWGALPGTSTVPHQPASPATSRPHNTNTATTNINNTNINHHGEDGMYGVVGWWWRVTCCGTGCHSDIVVQSTAWILILQSASGRESGLQPQQTGHTHISYRDRTSSCPQYNWLPLS